MGRKTYHLVWFVPGITSAKIDSES